MTSIVARALAGAASAEPPGGVSVSMPNTTGITVTGTSMMTVPETAGVRTRRNRASRAEIRSWKSAATTTRVASVAGPPSTIAVMQIPMNALELAMTSTWPEPNRPNRTACSKVAAPQTADRREHRPREVAFRHAGGPHHDRRDQYRDGDVQDRELQAEAEGQRSRRPLVGLVADA